jgi:hypothetical protein
MLTRIFEYVKSAGLGEILMANVWLCRDGDSPTSGGPLAVISLYECQEKLNVTKHDFYGDLFDTPRFGKSDDALATVRGNQHVVVELDEVEAKKNLWKPGFYLSPLTPKQAYVRLGMANP